MKFRKLRIAWSVFCGIGCVLLIVLWVRSYWREDFAQLQHGNVIIQQATLGQYFFVASNKGRCACVHITSGVYPWWINWGTSQLLAPGNIEMFPFNVREEYSWMGFDAYWFNTTDFGAFVPHWFLVALTGTVGAVPWLPWRFSLRSLLIATTVVAIVLGLIAWSMR